MTTRPLIEHLFVADIPYASPASADAGTSVEPLLRVAARLGSRGDSAATGNADESIDLASKAKHFMFADGGADRSEKPFVFVVTESDGSRTYGFCRRLARVRAVLDDAEQLLRYERCNTVEPKPRMAALCVVTSYPWTAFFTQALQVGANLSLNAISLLHTFLGDLGAMSPELIDYGQELSLDVNIGGGRVKSAQLRRSAESISWLPLFDALDASQVLAVFSSLCFDRRVLFLSKHLDRLSNSVLGAEEMLRPFRWQHIFIPVLPNRWLDYVSAPMPYIIGMHASMRERLRKYPLDDAVVVDLDERNVDFHEDDLSLVPARRMAKLEAVHHKAMASFHKCGVFDDTTCKQSFVRFFASVMTGFKQYLSASTLPNAAPGALAINSDLFFESRKPSVRRFLEVFSLSQHFEQFVQRCKAPENFHPLFEEYCLEKERRGQKTLKFKQFKTVRMRRAPSNDARAATAGVDADWGSDSGRATDSARAEQDEAVALAQAELVKVVNSVWSGGDSAAPLSIAELGARVNQNAELQARNARTKAMRLQAGQQYVPFDADAALKAEANQKASAGRFVADPNSIILSVEVPALKMKKKMRFRQDMSIGRVVQVITDSEVFQQQRGGGDGGGAQLDHENLSEVDDSALVYALHTKMPTKFGGTKTVRLHHDEIVADYKFEQLQTVTLMEVRMSTIRRGNKGRQAHTTVAEHDMKKSMAALALSPRGGRDSRSSAHNDKEARSATVPSREASEAMDLARPYAASELPMPRRAPSRPRAHNVPTLPRPPKAVAALASSSDATALTALEEVAALSKERTESEYQVIPDNLKKKTEARESARNSAEDAHAPLKKKATPSQLAVRTSASAVAAPGDTGPGDTGPDEKATRSDTNASTGSARDGPSYKLKEPLLLDSSAAAALKGGALREADGSYDAFDPSYMKTSVKQHVKIVVSVEIPVFSVSKKIRVDTSDTVQEVREQMRTHLDRVGLANRELTRNLALHHMENGRITVMEPDRTLEQYRMSDHHQMWLQTDYTGKGLLKVIDGELKRAPSAEVIKTEVYDSVPSDLQRRGDSAASSDVEADDKAKGDESVAAKGRTPYGNVPEQLTRKEASTLMGTTKAPEIEMNASRDSGLGDVSDALESMADSLAQAEADVTATPDENVEETIDAMMSAVDDLDAMLNDVQDDANALDAVCEAAAAPAADTKTETNATEANSADNVASDDAERSSSSPSASKRPLPSVRGAPRGSPRARAANTVRGAGAVGRGANARARGKSLSSRSLPTPGRMSEMPKVGAKFNAVPKLRGGVRGTRARAAPMRGARGGARGAARARGAANSSRSLPTPSPTRVQSTAGAAYNEIPPFLQSARPSEKPVAAPTYNAIPEFLERRNPIETTIVSGAAIRESVAVSGSVLPQMVGFDESVAEEEETMISKDVRVAADVNTVWRGFGDFFDMNVMGVDDCAPADGFLADGTTSFVGQTRVFHVPNDATASLDRYRQRCTHFADTQRFFSYVEELETETGRIGGVVRILDTNDGVGSLVRWTLRLHSVDSDVQQRFSSVVDQLLLQLKENVES